MFRLLKTPVASSVRGFATAKSHAAPKKIHGTFGRYAGATYVAASKAGILPKVETELAAVAATLNTNAAFASFFSDPSIAREAKADRMLSLLSEDKFSNCTRNLFQTMAGNGRLNETTKVINAFNELMEASRGIVKAVVITADALTAANSKVVQTAVTKMADGKKVEVEYKVDANILGGLQVQIGDKFMDLSVANRINSVNQYLDSA